MCLPLIAARGLVEFVLETLEHSRRAPQLLAQEVCSLVDTRVFAVCLGLAFPGLVLLGCPARLVTHDADCLAGFVGAVVDCVARLLRPLRGGMLGLCPRNTALAAAPPGLFEVGFLIFDDNGAIAVADDLRAWDERAAEQQANCGSRNAMSMCSTA